MKPHNSGNCVIYLDDNVLEISVDEIRIKRIE